MSVNRDQIKIVEFGMDDDVPSPSQGGSGGLKVIEYDKDREGGRDGGREDGRRRVATGADVGPIKIIEFDDDLKGGRAPTPAPERRDSRERPARTVGPVKIRDFDKEREAEKSIGGGPKIKIMEFD